MGARDRHSTIEGATFFSGMLSTGFFLSPAAPEAFAGRPFLSCPFMNHFRISDDCAKKIKKGNSSPSKNIKTNPSPTLVESRTCQKRKPDERDRGENALTISDSREYRIFSDPGGRTNRDFQVLGGDSGEAG
jgi:hypothetical protein